MPDTPANPRLAALSRLVRRLTADGRSCAPFVDHLDLADRAVRHDHAADLVTAASRLLVAAAVLTAYPERPTVISLLAASADACTKAEEALADAEDELPAPRVRS